MFGLAESGLAETLRDAETRIDGFSDLEVTTCLRRGELEIVTRYEPPAVGAYAALIDLLRRRHPRELFSTDGALIDDQVAALLAGRRFVTAESCTAGLLAARLADRAGSSAYLIGGVVSYSNEAKVAVLGVDAALIDEHGAVSEPVARAMAEGALARFDADTAVGITGIAGPGGGSAEKPVGTVCFGVALRSRCIATVVDRSRTSLRSPGSRNVRTCVGLPLSATPKHTVPTGFSAEPPPGPAIPVIPTAVSAPKRASAPSAIARATGSDTAPWSSISAASTPSSATLASLE